MKYLRIYLKQPSPSWLDYTLRNITLYMKKTEVKYSGGTVSSIMNKELTPFEQMKMTLRSNIKGLKKDEDKENQQKEQQ